MRPISALGLIAIIGCRTEPEKVVNVAPVFTSIVIVPDSDITSSTELLCVANAVDENNDQLLLDYQWTKTDGSVIGEFDRLQLSPEIVGPTEEITCTATVSDDSEGVTTSASVVLDNSAPIINSVTITPESVMVNSLLECTFDAEDPDLEEITASYAWTQNGTEVGTESSLQLDSEGYSNDDVIVCAVTVEDGFGGRTTDSAEVVIGNTPPAVGLVTLSPLPTVSTDSLTCTASDITDLEQDDVTLSYAWTVDGEPHTETSDTLSGPFLVGSDVVCTVTPNDGTIDGQRFSSSTTIVNSTPAVDSLTLSPGPIYTDGSITATAMLSDIDAEHTVSAIYTWHSTDGETGVDSEILGSSGDTIDGTLFDKDDQVYVVVTPNDGIEDGAPVTSPTLTISNSEPTGLTASVTSSDSFYNDSTLTCSASASDIDPEDAVLSYTHLWSTGDTGADLVLDGSMMPGSEVTCTATATDGSGASISVGAMETLVNRVPTVDSVTLPQDVTTETASIVCGATGSDLDGEIPTLSYTWTIGGVPNAETSNTLSDVFIYNDVIECTATSSDAMETGSSMTASTTVLNTPPVVDSVTLNPSDVYTNDTITAGAILSDVDGAQSAVLTANYEWFVDGSSAQNGSSNTFDGTLFNKDDQVYVVVTPHDGIEDGAPVTSPTLTISNSEPTGLTASVTSSDSFYNDSTLTCSASASDIDPEDAVLSYTHLWSTGDTGADLILDGSMMPGATITCTATATDTSGASISMDASEMLMNRAPTVDSVTLPQDATATTASILCDVTATDLDGETPSLSYAWTVGGSPSSELSDTLSGPFVYGDVIECAVSAADAMETGTSMSASTTVLNSMPTVTSVAIDPDPAYTNSTFNASVVLDDVDAAQVGTLTASYQWYADGAPVSGDMASLSNGTLNEFFAKGQDVHVVVTPNDGVEDGTPVQSNTVSVLNSVPVLTSVSITPDPAVMGTDDLTCDASATDADGDQVLYTYDWSDSSGTQQSTVEVSDTSDTFLTGGLTADTWNCTVTPFDGEDYGVSNTSSTTVENGCSSVLFDLVSSVSVPGPVFDYNEEFTIEGWVFSGGSLPSYPDQILLGVDGSASNEYRLSIADGGYLQVDWLTVNTCGSGSDTTTEVIFEAGTWTHFAFVSPNLVYKNGELVDTLGEDKRGGCFGNGPMYIGNFTGYDGLIGYVHDFRLWQTARSQSDIQSSLLGLDDPSSESALRGNWFTVEGSYTDASGNGYDGTSTNTIFVDECPQEDLDGDGVATWEDCDDDDANLPNSDDQDCDGVLLSAGDCDDSNPLVGMNVTGVSTDCGALSCDEVSSMGYSTGDGVYWLNPDGNGAFEAYCDMTTDGGGWTLAAKIESGSSSEWLYDSTAWTTVQTEFNETDFNLTSGEAKYSVFDTVALEEIRLEDPVNVNEAQLEAVGTSLLDFFTAQAVNTTATVLSTSYIDTSTISYIGYNTSYGICDSHRNSFVNNNPFRFNVDGSYNANGGNVATGDVRIGFWGSGSNSHVWHWTSTCGIGLGVKVYGYNGTTQSGTTFGNFTLLWVR